LISIERKTAILKFDLLPAQSTVAKYWPGRADSIGYGDNVVYLTFAKIEQNGVARWECGEFGRGYLLMRRACNRSAETVRGNLRVGLSESGEVIQPENYISSHRKGIADAIEGQAAMDLVRGLALAVSFRDEFIHAPEQTHAWLNHRGVAPVAHELKKHTWTAQVGNLSDDRYELLADVFGIVELASYQDFSATVLPSFSARLDEATTSPTMAQLF